MVDRLGGPTILGTHEVHQAILLSHNRRDPATLNLTYAVVDGLLRTRLDPETGRPYSKHCHKDSRRLELWLDKEQLSKSGGDDWAKPILRAMRDGAVTVLCLGNAFCGSKEYQTEVQYVIRNGFAVTPVFLEWLCKDDSTFKQWKCRPYRQPVPGGTRSLLDANICQFREWYAQADVVDFSLEHLQCAPATLFSFDSLVYEHLCETKYSRCRCDDGRSRCSEWSTASTFSPRPIPPKEMEPQDLYEVQVAIFDAQAEQASGDHLDDTNGGYSRCDFDDAWWGSKPHCRPITPMDDSEVKANEDPDKPVAMVPTHWASSQNYTCAKISSKLLLFAVTIACCLAQAWAQCTTSAIPICQNTYVYRSNGECFGVESWIYDNAGGQGGAAKLARCSQACMLNAPGLFSSITTSVSDMRGFVAIKRPSSGHCFWAAQSVATFPTIGMSLNNNHRHGWRIQTPSSRYCRHCSRYSGCHPCCQSSDGAAATEDACTHSGASICRFLRVSSTLYRNCDWTGNSAFTNSAIINAYDGATLTGCQDDCFTHRSCCAFFLFDTSRGLCLQCTNLTVWWHHLGYVGHVKEIVCSCHDNVAAQGAAPTSYGATLWACCMENCNSGSICSLNMPNGFAAPATSCNDPAICTVCTLLPGAAASRTVTHPSSLEPRVLDQPENGFSSAEPVLTKHLAYQGWSSDSLARMALKMDDALHTDMADRKHHRTVPAHAARRQMQVSNATCVLPPSATSSYAVANPPSLGLPSLGLPDLGLPSLGAPTTVGGLGSVACAVGGGYVASATCTNASGGGGAASTDTTTLGGLSSGASGGVLAPSGRIYAIPYNAQSVLIIDPVGASTDTTTLGGLSGTGGKWSGGVLAPNGRIYGIPYNAPSVLIIDPVGAS
eukprot:COSAG01_NODE_8287_length_2842_cov_5.149471_1_plen_888_part_10